jgi:hypothetical protein
MRCTRHAFKSLSHHMCRSPPLQGEVLVAERLPKRAETWQDKKTVLLQRMEQQQVARRVLHTSKTESAYLFPQRLCEDLAEAAQALASQRQQPEAPPSPSDALESFVTHDRCVIWFVTG